ncbi:MAG: SusC/RagA family TonB-linked outer membrane protein, partial [Bacteroidales bacterium]
KEGKAGQPLRVTVDSKLMVSHVKDYMSMMNASQFTDFVNEYGSESDKGKLSNHDTDWQKEIYRTAITSDNNVSLTGSIKNLPIRTSLGYLSQEGILKTDKMDRFTSALNLAPTFFDNNLKIELNAKYSYIDNDIADVGAIGAAATFDPTQSPYNEDGSYFNWMNADGKSRNEISTANPLMLLYGQEQASTINSLLGNLKFDYKIPFLPELTATLNLGYDRSASDVKSYKVDGWIDSEPGRIADDTYSAELNKNKLLDFYLNYINDFDGHKINLTGGYVYQSFYNEYETESFSTYEDETLNTHDVRIPTKERSVLLSFFMRGNYSFKERYLFTATIRTDASSKLNPDDRWGVFPSASFAWRVSEEGFLKNAQALSNLKLRLGYGQMGNVGDLGNYKFLTRYTSSQNQQALYQIGDNFEYSYRPEVVNDKLTWEVGETYNIGFDMGLWDQRLTSTIDFYVKNTRDLIAQQQIDPFTNFGTSVEANIGDIRNTGFEFSIDYAIIQKNDLNWSLGFNASYNKNKIIKLPTEQLFGGSVRGYGNNLMIRREGEAANSFYLYKQNYDEDGKPIEGKVANLNSDDVISDQDRYIDKNSDPTWVLGIYANFNYKNWRLSATGRANIGAYSYYGLAAAYSGRDDAFGYGLGNRHTDFYNTGFQTMDNTQVLNDYYLRNSSFFKLDNITIGYKIPKSVFKVFDLSLYGSVQNVFTITNYEGLDPETNGIDKNFYAIPTIYSFGLTINL